MPSLLRLLALLVTLSAFAAACGDGCCCDPADPNCNPPPPGNPAAILFDTLPQTVTCADDKDGDASNGVQIDVTVILKNDDGTGYGTATVTDGQGASTATAAFDADGRATMELSLVGGPAPGAENVLTATSSNGTKDLTVADTVRADCEVAPPGPPSCVFETPLDADNLIVADVPVRVRMSGGDPTDATQQALLQTGDVRIDPTGGPTAISQQLTASANVAEGTINLLNGTYGLTATLIDTASVFPAPVTCAVAGVVVQAPSAVTIEFPVDGDTYAAVDDADGIIANGINLPMNGTTLTNNTATFSLDCTGQPTQTGNLSVTPNGDGTFHLATTLPGVVGPDCTLTVHVQGNSDVAVSYHIDAGGVPVLDVAVTPDADGDGFYEQPDDTVVATANVLDVPVTITPTLPAGVWTGTLTVTDSNGNVVQTISNIALADGIPDTEVVQLPAGDASLFDIAVTATDGINTTASFGATVAVDTVDPFLSFFFPNAGLGVNGSNDIDGDPNNGLQVRIILVVSADAAACTVTVDGVDNVGAVSGTSCSLVLTLADGAHTLAGTVTDAAGHTTLGAPISFSSDGSIPTVNTLVVDKAGPDNVLNVADNGAQAAGNVSSGITLTVSSDLNGRTVVITTPVGTCSGSPAGGTVDIAGCVLVQGTNLLVVNGSDAAGNIVDATAASFTVTVDTVLPLVSIASPSPGSLLAANDADGNPANGLQFDVVVSSDAGDGQVVTVSDNGSSCGTGTLAGGGATIRCSIGEGNRSLTGAVSDAAGNPQTSAAISLAVDSQAPALLLAANNVTPGDDLDAVSTGIQVNVTVTPTGLTAGRAITISSDIEGAINTTGFACNSAGDGVPVTCRVTYFATNTHHLTASGVDEAGNVGTSNQVTVTVVTGFFFVDVTNPPLRNGFRSVGTAEDGDGNGANGAQVSVTGTTDAPSGATVQVLVSGVPEVATCTVNGVGVLSCTAFTLNDGQTGTFEVTVQSGIETGSSGQDSFRVDLGRPTTVITNPAAAGVTFNKASDLSPAAGLQTQVTVDVTECENGVLQILDGTTPIGSATIGASGTQAGLVVDVSDLVEGDAKTWTATCTDSEANTPTTPDSFLANVDITAPSAPTLTLSVVDVRSGVVNVAYTQPGDNNNSGTPTTVALFFQKGTAISDATFGGAGQVGVVVPQSGTAGGQAVSVDTPAQSLAFDNTWFAALRATDDVGNSSALATAQIAISTQQLVLGPPNGVTGWAQSMSRSRGDVNGDGIDDLVVGAPNVRSRQLGGFEVILGGATPAAISRTFVTPPSSLPCVAPPCNTAEAGSAVNIISSINDDPYDDVVVVAYDQRGGPTTGGGPEFILIYLGGPFGISAAQPPASVLEFTEGFSGFAGYDAQSVGDVDADGRTDWAFVASNLGTGYLFLNNGAVPPAGPIDSAATTIFSNSDFNNFFFFGAALAPVGKNGDAFDDIVVSCMSQQATLFLIHGRAVWPTTLDLANAPAADIAPMAQPPARSPGFALSSGDVDGDGDVDITYAASNGLHVILNTGTTWAGEADFNSPIPLGQHALMVASLNGDGRNEIVFGGDAVPASLAFGRQPMAGGTADTSYTVTSPGRFMQFTAVNLINSSAAPDLVVGVSNAPGSITIRF